MLTLCWRNWGTEWVKDDRQCDLRCVRHFTTETVTSCACCKEKTLHFPWQAEVVLCRQWELCRGYLRNTKKINTFVRFCRRRIPENTHFRTVSTGTTASDGSWKMTAAHINNNTNTWISSTVPSKRRITWSLNSMKKRKSVGLGHFPSNVFTWMAMSPLL